MRKLLLGFVVGILTLPVGAFAAAWMGWLPTNAKATPSTLEKAFAHLALDSAAARRAPHLANPIAPTEENLMAGMKLFKGDCAGCHGDANNAARREANVVRQRRRSGQKGAGRESNRSEERFLTAQADAFAGANAEEKVGLLRSK